MLILQRRGWDATGGRRRMRSKSNPLKGEWGSDYFPEGIQCGAERHFKLFLNSDMEL